MAERFNLTAQLQLQAPRNTSQVVGDIKKQLSGISTNVQVKGDARSLAQINKQMEATSKSAAGAARSVNTLNRNLSEAARRFSVITVATGTMLALARAIRNSVGEAIAFERELVKISQVTGKTVRDLQGLTSEITRLSTSLGASSSDLLAVSRVLAQAGFSAQKTTKALDILAKTSLGATFDSLTDTTEGAIAVLRQFGTEARKVGGDIKFLEQTMDAINSVSKNFAVESGDLITVIRRVGGVFESAGGSVNELIALFTSVRATTRETAETIATGLRTIFTRIQRTETTDQLAALGIQLRDSEGQFIGAFEAVRRLSQGLSALDPRDFRFAAIVEQLGGFRQIGKVIPLIRQFTTAQDALNVAQGASGSVAKDAITAQQSLAVQAQRVREEFAGMMRMLADSTTFRSIASGALKMASAFIKVVEALEPVLPLLTSLVGLKLGQALAPGLGALVGMKPRGRASGGKIRGFAGGGWVPGQGNGDTVPAMLTPGEFVIKKSSAKRLGPETLASMNRFRVGGRALRQQIADMRSDPKFGGKTSKKDIGKMNQLEQTIKAMPEEDEFGGAFLSPEGGSQTLKGTVQGSAISSAFGKNATFKLLKAAKAGSQLKKEAMDLERAAKEKQDFVLQARSLNPAVSNKVEEGILDGVEKSVLWGSRTISRMTGQRGAPSGEMANILRTANVDNVIGNIFEASILKAGAPFDDRDANAPFDFPGGLGGVTKAFHNASALSDIQTDAKTRYTASNISSFLTKVRDWKADKLGKRIDALLDNLDIDSLDQQFATAGKTADEANEAKRELKNKVRARQNRATGGTVDTVPALLTPGEFVINSSSAQKIGYGNLNRMNKTGISRFATGGVVGRRRLSKGGPGFHGPKGGGPPAPSGGGSIDTSAIQAAIDAGVANYNTDHIKAVIDEGLTNFSSDGVKAVIDEGLTNLSTDSIKQAIDEGLVNYATDQIKPVIDEGLTNYSSDAIKAVIDEGVTNFSSDAVKPVVEEGVTNFNSDAVKPVIEEALINFNSDAVKAVIEEGATNFNSDAIKSVIEEGATNFNSDAIKAVIEEGAVNFNSDSVKAVIEEGVTNFNSDSVKAVIDEGVTNFNSDSVKAVIDEGVTNFNSDSVKAVIEAGEANFNSESVKAVIEEGAVNFNSEAVKAVIEEGATNFNSEAVKAVIEEAEQNLNTDSLKSAIEESSDKVKGAFAEVASDISSVEVTPGGGGATGGGEKWTAADGGPSPLDKLVGEGEARTKEAAGPKPTKISGDERAEVDKELQMFGTDTKASRAALTKFKKELQKGSSKEKALGDAIDAGKKSLKEQAKSAQATAKQQKKFSAKLQKAGAAVGKVASGGAKGGMKGGRAQLKAAGGMKGVMGGSMAGIEKVAGAAQAFTMAGAAVTALTANMSGLSAATKQAITEVSGWATGMVGVGGSVVQVMASMATASAVSASADLDEAAASKVAASAGMTRAFIGVAAAAAGVALMFKWFAASARADADQLKKSNEKRMKAIEGGTDSGAGLSDSVQREVALRGQAGAGDSAAIWGGAAAAGAGLAAAGGAMAAGAAMGSVVPIVGTVVGALAGLAVGFFVYNDAQAEAIAEAANMRVAIEESVNAYVQATTALNKFNQELADIDLEKNLSPEETVKRRLAAGTRDMGGGNLPRQFEILEKVAEKAGKSIANLTDADFEDDPAALAAFQFATKATAKTLEGLNAKTKAARDTLSQAADIEITGDKGFAQLIAEGGQFAQALKQAQEAIRAEARARIQSLQAEANSIRTAAKARKDAGGSVEEFDSAMTAAAAKEKEIAELRTREAQQQKDLVDGYKGVADAAQKQKQAELAAAKAAEALRLELNAMNAAMRGVRLIAEAQSLQASNIASMTAIQGGKDQEFKAPKIAGLDQIDQIDDIRTFKTKMNTLINDLPPAMRAQFKKQVDTVTEANKVLTTGKDRVLKQFGTITKGQTVDVNKILRASGVDLSRLSPEIAQQLKTELATAAADGLSPEEFDKIFAPIRQLGETAQKNLSEIEKLRQTEITNYAAYLNLIESQREKQLKADAKVMSTEQKGEALMAKARGGKLTTGQMDLQRTDAAQQNLRGTGLRAGDAKGAAQAIKIAKLRRKQIAMMKNNANLTNAQRKALMKEDKRLIDVTKKAANELDRLADQSEKAGELMEEIEAERAKRETLTNLLGEFVKGGDSERKSLTGALLGVQSAIATGTVQNQTPEQRSATFDMLDRLKDIAISGAGGLTGEQIKQEIIFRDAIAMGLDPKVAEKLATATSKEQELINALDRLTKEMVDAARKQAGQVFAQGGLVQYRAGGGNIFKPKGTDTVPAMLTPGEFVIKRSAVKAIGMGTLSAINSGQYANGGLVQYRQGGGAINPMMGAVAGGAHKIPTSDMYKQMFYQSAARTRPGDFIKIAKAVNLWPDWVAAANALPRPVSERKLIQAITFAGKKGRLDVTKMGFADKDAQMFDRIAGQTRILERLNAEEVRWKSIDSVAPFNPRNFSPADLDAYIKAYEDFKKGVAIIASTGFNVSADDTKKSNFSGNIINQQLGRNPVSRLRHLRWDANRRAILSDTNIAWLNQIKRLVPAGAGPGQNIANPPYAGAIGARPANATGGGAKFTGGGGGAFGGVGLQPDKVKKPVAQADWATKILQGVGILKMAKGGSVPRFAQGGQADTVPAMLTPGEFVMSKGAVQRHGVGYMKNLNRGRVPGFNRGGLVGRGNVQYKQGGGAVAPGGGAVISLDPSRVQEVLTSFTDRFAGIVSNMEANFVTVGTSLSKLADTLGNLTMTHDFSGTLGLSVNVSNKDAIVEEVSKGITPVISGYIEEEIGRQIRNMKDNP